MYYAFLEKNNIRNRLEIRCSTLLINILNYFFYGGDRIPKIILKIFFFSKIILKYFIYVFKIDKKNKKKKNIINQKYVNFNEA